MPGKVGDSPGRGQRRQFLCGLGGREVTVPDIEKIAGELFEAAAGKQKPLTQWIGLRE